MFERVVKMMVGSVAFAALAASAFNPNEVDREKMLMGTNHYEPMFNDGSRIIMLKECSMTQMTGIIVKTPHDHVIVFDGGNLVDTDNLIDWVRLINGGKVSAWFHTHPHNDHYGVLQKILTEKPDALEIPFVAHDFPPMEWCEGSSDKELLEIQPILDKSGIRQVRITKGMKWTYDGVTVTALNQFISEPKRSINDVSIVFKVELGGKTFMVTGDVHEITSDRLIEEYGDALKCDIVQVSHHGQNGAPKRFYEKVNPEMALWPTPYWLWENSTDGKHLGNFIYKTNYTKCWFQEIGCKRHYITMGHDVVIE